MKRFAIITVMGLSAISTWAQIKGLDDYQRTKSLEEMDANEGTRYYYKPNTMAYFGYSCYIFAEPDSDGDYLLIEENCPITEKKVVEVYDELIRVLHENGLQPENYKELTGTEELSFDNVYNAAILDSEPIFVHFSIGVSNLYFTVDNYSVELKIMDRKGRKLMFR
jgi:hypothetical protein